MRFNHSLILFVVLTNTVCGIQKSDEGKYISKCCKSNQVLVLVSDIFKCKVPRVDLKYPLVPVYNRYLTKRAENAKDIFKFHDKKLAEEDFIQNADDYTKEYEHYLIEDGSLMLIVREVKMKPKIVNNENFCLDYLANITENKTEIFYFSISEQPEENEQITTYGLIISCVFLTLVLLVYAILPELRNLGGLVLMSSVFCLLNVEFFFFVISVKENNREFCTFATYYIYFFQISYFCWINVLSFDIWSIFKGFAKYHAFSKNKTRKKYFLYCIYGLGTPFAMTLLLFILDNIELPNSPSFKPPALKIAPCFLDAEQSLLYLHIPIAILIGINIMLYSWTAFYYGKHCQQEDRVYHNDLYSKKKRHSKRLWMYLKLCIVMGISWTLEVISALAPDWNIWYITDTFNALSGLMIFIIFVCKKKILKKLKKKLTCKKSSRAVNRLKRADSDTSETSQDSVGVTTVSFNPHGIAKSKPI